MAAVPMRQEAIPSAELTQDDVQRMAQILGLPIGPEELPEVTYRLAALVGELDKLTRLDLHQEEPIPLFPATDEVGGG